mmetsp:Transcript_67661/g.195902  ORF Transcript_67661/g.195902 Transcript_67661/m.195902 type:complete len:565 (-) Transcript_67661:17-1711(-)
MLQLAPGAGVRPSAEDATAAQLSGIVSGGSMAAQLGQLPPRLYPGDLGFRGFVEGCLQVEFGEGQSPLGLVVDWSLGLPVACGTVPRSPASSWPALVASGNPGNALVLVRINGQNVVPGTPRPKVEAMLAHRPLALLLEHPWPPEKPSQQLAPWRRLQTPLAGSPPATQATPQPQQASRRSTPSPPATGAAQMVALSFFERHPERSPISRWGRMAAPPAHLAVTMSSAQPLKQLRNQLSLPRLVGFGAPADAASAGLALSATWGSGLRSAPRSLPALPTAPSGVSQALTKSQSLTQIPRSLKDPQDPTYNNLLDGLRGPGLPAKWPLGHDARFKCCLDDFRLVGTLWEAYEVGFRGRKRVRLIEEQLTFGILSPRKKVVEPADGERPAQGVLGEFPQAWCDACGSDISARQGEQGYLWYCRQCKSRGCRFELCLQCHAVEVLQSEGKHAGPAPHPHFLRCQHRALETRTNLRTLYPGVQHLCCALCDVCGDYIPGLKGCDDRVTVTRRGAASGAKAPFRPPGSGELLYCPCCPEEVGLRFEMCVPCAQSLSELGQGIQRLSAVL